MDPKARGMMLGLAIGDALGMPVEFMGREQIEARFGPGGIRDFPGERGMFTDDTQMSMAVAEALIECGRLPVERLMEAVVRRFVDWGDSPDNNRSPGITTMAAVWTLAAGKPWLEAGNAGSKGCGSLMRTAPVGYFYRGDPSRMREAARAVGLCTHKHPTAVASCLAASRAVALALEGVPPEAWLADILRFAAGTSPEFDELLARVPEAARLEDPARAFFVAAPRHRGWTAEEVFAVAYLAVLRHPDNFAECLRFAVNNSGDSDSIGCVAGALHGAYLGPDAIPESWKARIERRDDLESLADRLAAAAAELP